MTYSIRNARVDDAESMVELLNPIILAGKFTTMENVSLENQIDFLRGIPQRSVCHVAVCDDSGKILGMQDVLPLLENSNVFRHVGEISTFVSLTSQNRGIGKALFKATFQAAKELDFSKITAIIRADNPTAISFYVNQGFEIIGTTKKHAFINGRYVDEVLAEIFCD